MPAPTSPATTAAVLSRGPFRLAVLGVAITIFVILFGAMVTSTGSGLAFADWPTSDGQLMPPRSYQTLAGFLEHFHRLIAAATGLVSLLLTVWLWRSPAARRDQRIGAALGLVLVSAQGVIGGIHVLEGLPLLSAAVHGTLAQITFATFAITAYRLSPRWSATVPATLPAGSAARNATAVAAVLLVVQTLVGAIARHSGSEHALWTHVVNAFVVFLVVVIAAALAGGRCGAIHGVAGLARLLMSLLVLQIVLGFVALLVRTGKHPENIERLWRATLISAHVLLGALLTLTASLLWAHVRRGTLAGRSTL